MANQIYIRRKGTQTTTSEYGYPMQAVDSFQAIVPQSMHGDNPDIAKALVLNNPSIASAAGATAVVQHKLKDGSYVVEGTRTRLNVARRQDDFQLQYSTGLRSETTSVDAGGVPLYVEYDGVGQIASAQVDAPTFEIRCVGIRDISGVGTPGSIQNEWINAVNSDEWDGFGIGSVRCVSVNFDPHYISDTQSVYRIEFVFQALREGQSRYIYWIDPATGKPPYDLTFTNWSRLVNVYRSLAYNSTWPFSETT